MFSGADSVSAISADVCYGNLCVTDKVNCMAIVSNGHYVCRRILKKPNYKEAADAYGEEFNLFRL